MMTVQSVGMPSDQPRLVVQTWTGIVIHVLLLQSPPKTRTIKRILQEGTDNGIGTLFLINRDILPEQGTRVSIPEWLLALHALTHDRVYTISLDGDSVSLAQMHFEPIGISGDYAVQVGPAPNLEKLRFLRTQIRPRVIRGEWQLADFGVEAFWKDPYSPKHASGSAYHRPDPREYSWRSYSSTSWGQPKTEEIPNPSYRPPARADSLNVAYATLELTAGATYDEARAAFRKLAMAYHPDTSALPKDEAEARFRLLNEAFEIVRVANKWR
jgi:hypothetical protein